MLSRQLAARLSRRLRPVALQRSFAGGVVAQLPRQVPTKAFEKRPEQPDVPVSNVTEELSGTDPAVPWFLQSETIDVPTHVPVEPPSPAAHFSYIPNHVSAELPQTISALQTHILSGPSANLIARPESGNAEEELTPITLIHPASLTKDPSADAYGDNDWIMVVQVRSSAAGSVRRVALDIGKFLKNARPPAMGPEVMEPEDFLGPRPPREIVKKEPVPIPPQRPKGMSRIEHELGKSLPSWAVNRIALQRKFPDGWKPPKVLSREAQEGIRLLHAASPEQFGVEHLSEQFRISPESVRRILKAGKWAVSGEVRSRQDRRASEQLVKTESAEMAELRRMAENNHELAADGESPVIEGEDMTAVEIEAQEAEIKAQQSTPGLVPVRYEGLVMTAADAAATHTTAKSKTNGKRGDGNWCLVDAEWCVVHVMTGQARFNYDIEGMWREFQVLSQNRAANPHAITSEYAAPPLKARSRARRDVLGQDIGRQNRLAQRAQTDDSRRFGDKGAPRNSGFRRGFATSAVSRSPDSTHLPATLNQLLSRHSSSEGPVTVRAWIRSARYQKSVTFLEVSDGTLPGSRTLQAILRTASLQPEDLKRLNIGAAVELTGQLQPGKGSKAGQDIELLVSALRIVSNCDASYALVTPTIKQHNNIVEVGGVPYSPSEAERMNPHLLGRLPRFAAVMRTRDRMEQGMAAYLAQNDFVKVACPVVTSSDCEGGGEVFQVGADRDVQSLTPLSSFWGAEPAYLTVSSQLHLEAMGLGLARVWTLNPAFRAEGSATSRHLAEFWMLEAEMYFAELDAAMELAEGVVRAAVRAALANTDDMQLLTLAHPTHVDTLGALLQPAKWARITYHDAHKLLSDAHAERAFVTKPHERAGLSSEHERYLAEVVFRAPVFVTHYPRAHKAFYMQRSAHDRRLVDCFDLLVPGVGELVGGSVRNSVPDADKGERLKWYTHELKQFGGAVPHAGFGLGMERLAAYITYTDNVRDVVPFPRTKGRVRF